jgi:hypothetical protein
MSNENPFADGEGAPSLSFKDAPVGTSYTGIITEAPKVVQARNFDDGKPAFYDDGNPKKTIVTNLDVDGEPRSLWAPIPSALKTALIDAQKAAGVFETGFEVGGTLTVTLVGEKPNENSRLNAQKLYAATYVPPKVNAFAAQADAPTTTAATAEPQRPANIPPVVWDTLGAEAKAQLVAAQG